SPALAVPAPADVEGGARSLSPVDERAGDSVATRRAAQKRRRANAGGGSAGSGRSHPALAAGQHRDGRAAPRQLRARAEERRVRLDRARSHRRQDPGARRDGRQPAGSRFPHQPGRLRRREHAPDRAGGQRAAAPHRPRRAARGAAADPGVRPAPGAQAMTDQAKPRPNDWPAWFPGWASQLADLYFSGTTSAFVLHGNTYDVFRIGADDERRYGILSEFLAEQVFGRWSLVLHYDLGRGLRPLAGRDEKRLKEMVTLTNKKVGDLSA